MVWFSKTGIGNFQNSVILKIGVQDIKFRIIDVEVRI